jgi:hypothetical protein
MPTAAWFGISVGLARLILMSGRFAVSGCLKTLICRSRAFSGTPATPYERGAISRAALEDRAGVAAVSLILDAASPPTSFIALALSMLSEGDGSRRLARFPGQSLSSRLMRFGAAVDWL